MSPIQVQRLAIAFFFFACALLGASLAHMARHFELLPRSVRATLPLAATEADPAKGTSQAPDTSDEGKAAGPTAPTALAAKPPVDIFSLSRTPIANIGRQRYQVLGLGQDDQTGAQVVWLRSLGSNRISGFPEGAAVFDGPVRVERINSTEVAFRHDGKLVNIALDVE